MKIVLPPYFVKDLDIYAPEAKSGEEAGLRQLKIVGPLEFAPKNSFLVTSMVEGLDPIVATFAIRLEPDEGSAKDAKLIKKITANSTLQFDASCTIKNIVLAKAVSPARTTDRSPSSEDKAALLSARFS